ncbi:hypothetical protein ANANG_G00148980 [Anguilla anguilla]|uniref:Uncharacterized protein n=1 Tax=Anguilla anguilla TaxID=7936 RepID=A0A9D3RXW2_ANGAN|nr:hypothetical protein ANANG_G00148980 [Anguilla anguilla]
MRHILVKLSARILEDDDGDDPGWGRACRLHHEAKGSNPLLPQSHTRTQCEKKRGGSGEVEKGKRERESSLQNGVKKLCSSKWRLVIFHKCVPSHKNGTTPQKCPHIGKGRSAFQSI